MDNRIIDSNWQIHWRITESAGLAIYLADFHGRRVLWEGSLPFVLVDHQQREMEVEEPLETHGPFWAPLGRRSQVSDVRIQSFRGGFELAADFAAGPYRYTQMWRFHDDGRIAPWLTIHGGGLHDAHTYHPHWRFDFDLDGAMEDAVEHFEDGRWQRISEEGWFPFTGDADSGGGVWRQVDFGSGAAVTIRPNAWEDAEVFAIRFHQGEWGPYYPHSEVAAQPYPAAYVGDEPLDGMDVTLWYVGHVHFDAAFPFTAGPWIRVTGLTARS
jgi:hypothetical protein